MRSPSIRATLGTLAAILVIAAMAFIVWQYAHRADLRGRASAQTHGDPRRGAALFIQYGCGSCHSLAAVRTAVGNVGPPLDGIATRVFVAGKLANNPENMERWIRDPQHVSPGTAMPNLGVGEQDARDITAFLYTRGK